MNTTHQIRPFGIKMLTIVKVITGVVYIGYALLYTLDVQSFNQLDIFGHNNRYDFIVFLINTPSILFAYALWRLKRWAWIMVMLQSGIHMAVDFSYYMRGETPFAQMFINIVIVFYLNQRDVQNIFLSSDESQTVNVQS